MPFVAGPGKKRFYFWALVAQFYQSSTTFKIMAAGDFEGRLWQRKMGVRKWPDHACFTKWSEGYLLLVRSGLSATSSSKILDERLRGYYYCCFLFIIIDYKRIRDS